MYLLMKGRKHTFGKETWLLKAGKCTDLESRPKGLNAAESQGYQPTQISPKALISRTTWKPTAPAKNRSCLRDKLCKTYTLYGHQKWLHWLLEGTIFTSDGIIYLISTV